MKEFYKENGIAICNDDNINVLREIPNGTVNLIYCDILYNTGKVFSSYNDNLGKPEDAIKWYCPRIVEMKRILADNGSCFIHCNWRLDSYMRILMDNVFGFDCFTNRIDRQHSFERGFFSIFDPQIDVILYYVKDSNKFVFNEIQGKKPKIVPLFEDGHVESRSQVLSYNGEKIDLVRKNKHWLVSENEFKILARKGEIQIINGLPYRFSNVKSQGNLWNEYEMLDQYDRTLTNKTYDTPKPEAVLERIILTCSNN